MSILLTRCQENTPRFRRMTLDFITTIRGSGGRFQQQENMPAVQRTNKANVISNLGKRKYIRAISYINYRVIGDES